MTYDSYLPNKILCALKIIRIISLKYSSKVFILLNLLITCVADVYCLLEYTFIEQVFKQPKLHLIKFVLMMKHCFYLVCS